VAQPEHVPWPPEVVREDKLMQQCRTCQLYEQGMTAVGLLGDSDGLDQDSWRKAHAGLYAGRTAHQQAKHPVWHAYSVREIERRRAGRRAENTSAGS
jgi:hypothetical protein